MRVQVHPRAHEGRDEFLRIGRGMPTRKLVCIELRMIVGNAGVSSFRAQEAAFKGICAIIAYKPYILTGQRNQKEEKAIWRSSSGVIWQMAPYCWILSRLSTLLCAEEGKCGSDRASVAGDKEVRTHFTCFCKIFQYTYTKDVTNRPHTLLLLVRIFYVKIFNTN